MALGCNLFNFPTLMDEERQLMEAMIRGRMGLDKDNLKVVRTLKRVLTIPSDIFVMFDESFYQYLCLTSQMAFRLCLFYTCFCVCGVTNAIRCLVTYQTMFCTAGPTKKLSLKHIFCEAVFTCFFN